MRLGGCFIRVVQLPFINLDGTPRTTRKFIQAAIQRKPLTGSFFAVNVDAALPFRWLILVEFRAPLSLGTRPR
jgi:hypothetical protein